MNVLQGKKSISCANSVLPVFMGDSSPGNCRGEPLRVQIDTTQNRLETLIGQLLAPRAGSANRTAVGLHLIRLAEAYGLAGLPEEGLSRLSQAARLLDITLSAHGTPIST